MKENIGQPHMLPTQSGNCMSKGLDSARKLLRSQTPGIAPTTCNCGDRIKS